MRILTPILLFASSPAFAVAFDRPTPQAQSATAEFWFALATIALCLALYAVHWIVDRR